MLKVMGIRWNGNWAFGCDFPNNDFRSEVIKGELCGGLCAKVKQCTHFTWYKGVCYLKHGHVSRQNAIATGSDEYVCGIIRSAPSSSQSSSCSSRTRRSTRKQRDARIQRKGNWAHGCDFYNHDFHNEKTRGEHCGHRCSQVPRCTHFTWYQGVCYMKEGPVTKANAFATGSDDYVCGVMESRSSKAVSSQSSRHGVSRRKKDSGVHIVIV